MIGKMTSTSLAALVVAGGLTLTSGLADAADLGGNCCADLEERVAELEATTVRKGNRKVSVQIYGQISEAIVFWNDGGEKNTYVVEDYLAKNRFGFQGNARINSEWSAGFQLEMGARAYRSSSTNQLALGASNNTNIPAYNIQSLAMRQANWWIQSSQWGRITVGRTNDAVNGISSINLANPGGFSGMSGPGYINNSFFMRIKGQPDGVRGLSQTVWGDAANFRNGDGPASLSYSESGAGIKYTSPFFLGQTKSSGFRFDAMWGMDDFWSVGLRYAETFGAIRIAAGAGYSWWGGPDRGMCSGGGSGGSLTPDNPATNTRDSSNTDCSALQGSFSVIHVPTGLYVQAGAGIIEDKKAQAAWNTVLGGNPGNFVRGVDNKHSVWNVQAGWQARLNSLGNTTFWGQVVQYDTGMGTRNTAVQTIAASDLLNPLGGTAVIAGSQTRYWGGGISQEISAASMTLWAGYHVGSTDIVLQRANTSGTRGKSREVEDFSAFYTGATIRF